MLTRNIMKKEKNVLFVCDILSACNVYTFTVATFYVILAFFIRFFCKL